MIFDSLDNIKMYEGIHPKFKKISTFIEKAEKNDLPEGRYELDDEDYAIIARYQTELNREEYEAHNEYLDVQYLVEGTERIYVSDRLSLKATAEYCKEEDYILFKGASICRIDMKVNTFVIFFQEDAHMPKCLINEVMDVKKIILKLKV